MRVVLDVDILSQDSPHARALVGASGWFALACLALAVAASVPVCRAGAWPGLSTGLAALAASVALLSLAALPLHELVHAAFFKLLGPAGTRVRFGYQAGMLYATCPGARLARGRFCCVLLAPLVTLTCAFVALGALAPVAWAPLASVWLVALHAAGCVGDLYFVLLICRTPAATLVEDTERGICLLAGD